ALATFVSRTVPFASRRLTVRPGRAAPVRWGRGTLVMLSPLTPESSAGLRATVGLSVTGAAGESSEVLLSAAGAGAVRTRDAGGGSGTEGGNGKRASPVSSVVTVVAPTNVRPDPVGSVARPAKNSTRKTAAGVLLSVPRTAVTPLNPMPPTRTGVFWRLFGPVCGPPGVFELEPSGARSIPSPVLAKSKFDWTALPVPAVTSTPAPPLKAMVFPAPAAVPPILLR